VEVKRSQIHTHARAHERKSAAYREINVPSSSHNRATGECVATQARITLFADSINSPRASADESFSRQKSLFKDISECLASRCSEILSHYQATALGIISPLYFIMSWHELGLCMQDCSFALLSANYVGTVKSIISQDEGPKLK
jgi:hypothetical protein